MKPEEVKRLAPTMALFLKTMRTKGEITPAQPWDASRIISRWHNSYSGQPPNNDKDWREIVHYLRSELGEPIGSNVTGYWYCLSEREWDETRKQLLARIKDIQRAADGPSLKFKQDKDKELLLNHPVTEAIKEQFNAREV